MTTTELDPRIERTRRVVLEAAADLVSECGFGRTTIEAVAERSGVARSTIYRHWSNTSDLLLEAVGTKVSRVEATLTGELHSDVAAILGHASEMLSERRTRSIFASFVSESAKNTDSRDILKKIASTRRAAMTRILSEAKKRGEIPEHVNEDDLGSDLAAGVFFHGLVEQGRVSGDWLEDHIARVIALHSTA